MTREENVKRPRRNHCQNSNTPKVKPKHAEGKIDTNIFHIKRHQQMFAISKNQNYAEKKSPN